MKKIMLFFIFFIVWASDNAFLLHHAQLPGSAFPSSLTTNDEITIPKMFSYQGKITDSLGNPVPTDTYQLTFRLYTQPAGGTPFWNETQRILVKDGLFSVLLGAVNPINTVPENGQMWLSLQVGNAPELTPRLRIVSSPYSYLSQHSAYADTAEYARVAPTPDSVRIAANSHRLQGKDTSDFDNRFVNENQENSITSSMIVNGTIQRNDVALNFKAPFADTADYARISPASESSLVAANSHRLQGKDTSDFDNRFVNENQENSITSSMIVNGTIIGADLNQMNANQGQVLKWNGTTWAPANDEIGGDSAWIRGTPDSVLFTIRQLGIARFGNTLYGNSNARSTHINLGVTSQTGTSAMNHYYCTVGGGYGNTASGDTSVIAGGAYNTASGKCAFVGGGRGDTASGAYSFVGGGYRNKATGGYATIAGGHYNIADTYAFVGGGYADTASGSYSFVGGGFKNKATGGYATVPGGHNNIARGAYSLAAGRYARANHGGCFVWSDEASGLSESVYTTGASQFRVRARGGTWFFSNATMTSGVYLAPNSNSWSSISDKENITDISSVNKKELLKRIAELQIKYYRIKGQKEDVKHIGLTAEEFYKTFGVGESDKAINMADADGILFTAIQALYEENQKLREEIEFLKAELEKRK